MKDSELQKGKCVSFETRSRARLKEILNTVKAA